jgi:PKD repeat protein
MKKVLVGILLLTFLFSPILSALGEEEIPVEGPVEEPVEEPIEELIEDPVEDPIEDPVEELIEDPIAEEVPLYFSEIAWMGTEVSANDEWIELYNPNDFSVELDGWIIRNQDSSFEILLSGTVAPDGYFLLERTDDDTVSDVEADQIYTGALKNDGEFLELVDPFERVVDEIDVWHTGNNEIKATMARADFELFGFDPLAWCTSGTNSPGGENNCYIPIEEPVEDPIEDPVEDLIANNPPVPVIEIQGDTAYMHVNVTGEDSYDPDGDKLTYFWDYGDGFVSDLKNPKSYYYATPGEKIIVLTVTDELGLSANVSVNFVATEKITSSSSGGRSTPEPEYVAPPKSYQSGVVVIDSVLPNPEGTDSGAELIILKNTSDEIIDLKGWKLVDAGDNSKIFDSLNLPPKSSLEIGQDVFKINLNNDEETLYLYDPAGNPINEMSWQDAQSGQWVQNFSFLYDGIAGSVSSVIDGDTFKVIL